MIYIVKLLAVRGVLIAVNEIRVHMYTHLSHRWRSSSVMSRISHLLIGLIAVKKGGGGQNNEFYVVHTFVVSTILYFIYQQPTLTYAPFISVVCCILLFPCFSLL
jgi:hypothetical protein